MEAAAGRQDFDVLAGGLRDQMVHELLGQLPRLGWDAAALAEHRRVALHEMLDHAAAHSPWHRDRLDGTTLDDLDPSDLTALPVMTKTDLMENWDHVVTDPALSLGAAKAHLERVDREGLCFLLDRYLVFTTGGSTGEPGIFPWSVDEVARWAASNIRLGADAGAGPPERLAFVGARSPRHPSAAFPFLLFGREMGQRRLVPIDQPLASIVTALNAIDPDRLVCVGSMLGPLVDAARSGDLRIRPESILLGGDAADPRAVDAAAYVFGVRPSNGYPTTDVGSIASEAPGTAGMVVNDDLLIVEPVDEWDRPITPSAESHHLLVTSLHHRTMPLIRYRIDDRVRLDPDGHGRYPAYACIAAIDGRADDLFHYDDVVVHPHVFRTVLSKHPAIADYQVRQTARGAAVHVSGTRIDAEAIRSELDEHLGRAGLRSPDVAVHVVDTIQRTAVGKRQLFVSNP